MTVLAPYSNTKRKLNDAFPFNSTINKSNQDQYIKNDYASSAAPNFFNDYSILNISSDVSLKILIPICLYDIKKTSKQLYRMMLSLLKTNFWFYEMYFSYHFYNNSLELINFLYGNADVMSIYISNISVLSDKLCNNNNTIKRLPNYIQPRNEFENDNSEEMINNILKITDPNWRAEISSEQLFELLTQKSNSVIEWLLVPFFVNKIVNNSTNFFKYEFFEIYHEMVIFFSKQGKVDCLFDNLVYYYSKAIKQINPVADYYLFDEVEYAIFIDLFKKEFFN